MTVPTILAVDDSANDLVLLELAWGAVKPRFILQSVTSGEEAMAYLEGKHGYANRQRFPAPSLVLLDLKMPRKSGFDVLSWIRASQRFTQLPVLVFTSSVHSQDRIRAVELGANGFVGKPIGYEALQQFVRRLDDLLSGGQQPNFSAFAATAEATTEPAGPAGFRADLRST